MKNLFVPYPIAVIAKEKGFNEPCLAVYHKKKFVAIMDTPRQTYILPACENKELGINYSTAPLYQQLVDWFREKHEINVVIRMIVSTHESDSHKMFYSYELVGLETSKCFIGSVKETYYQALTKAIEEAFKLI